MRFNAGVDAACAAFAEDPRPDRRGGRAVSPDLRRHRDGLVRAEHHGGVRDGPGARGGARRLRGGRA